LYNESGGHRIQRVPPTERKGRVHTSTVTVAIVDPEIVKTTIANKHQNSCRITHIPSGIVATAQCRSRENSYNEALATITNKVDNIVSAEYNNSIASNRREQVGSGMRGDKIRTYRFQDDRVQDHITNKVSSTKKVLQGNFDLLWS